jgi:hypothetical protein
MRASDANGSRSSRRSFTTVVLIGNGSGEGIDVLEIER